MLTVKSENLKTEEDFKIFNSILEKVESMETQTIDWFYAIHEGFDFGGYAHCGRGGNHVWVAKKSDNERIVLIYENGN